MHEVLVEGVEKVREVEKEVQIEEHVLEEECY